MLSDELSKWWIDDGKFGSCLFVLFLSIQHSNMYSTKWFFLSGFTIQYQHYRSIHLKLHMWLNLFFSKWICSHFFCNFCISNNILIVLFSYCYFWLIFCCCIVLFDHLFCVSQIKYLYLLYNISIYCSFIFISFYFIWFYCLFVCIFSFYLFCRSLSLIIILFFFSSNYYYYFQLILIHFFYVYIHYTYHLVYIPIYSILSLSSSLIFWIFSNSYYSRINIYIYIYCSYCWFLH